MVCNSEGIVWCYVLFVEGFGVVGRGGDDDDNSDNGR